MMILLFAYLFLSVFVLQWSVASLMTDASISQLIDWQFNYSVEQVYALLKSYGSESREWYILIELTVNSFIPFTYGFLFGFVIIALFKKISASEQLIKSLMLVPLAALLADVLENACILLLLTNYPYKLVLVAKTANILTFSKWILIMASLTLIASGILIKGYRMVKFKLVPKSISQ
jgi:hypothetical protein